MGIYIHTYIGGVGLRRSLPTSAILLLCGNRRGTFGAESKAEEGGSVQLQVLMTLSCARLSMFTPWC